MKKTTRARSRRGAWPRRRRFRNRASFTRSSGRNNGSGFCLRRRPAMHPGGVVMSGTPRPCSESPAAAHEVLDGFEQAILGQPVHGEDTADDLGGGGPSGGRVRVEAGRGEGKPGENGGAGDAGRAGVVAEAPAGTA